MNGIVHAVSPYLQYVTWEVPEFSELPPGTGFSTQSPEFRFADATYCLRLYPNGRKTFKCGAYVDIALVRLDSTLPKKDMSYSIWLKSKKGEPLPCRVYRSPVECVGGIEYYMERQAVEEIIKNSVPHDSLTVLCDMLMNDPDSRWKLQLKGTVTSHAELELKGLPCGENVLSDYKQLLLKGTESDTCLVVSGKEFRAHRCVLRARSTVFDAMFGHETPEKESGRVDIDDLDPEIFGILLEYLYTGNFGAGLSDSNAFGLYKAADQYGVPALMSECVAHMRRSLSADSFFEVLSYALQRNPDAGDLMELAVEFFRHNMSQVVSTEKWEQLMKENTACAQKLLVKAVVPQTQ